MTVETDSLPIYWPCCGFPLHVRGDGTTTLFVCSEDRVFWIDDTGALRAHDRLIRFPVPTQ
jgi:hypothetical protein